MGIVDYTVTISLAFSGFGLAAPVIEEKVPKLAILAEQAKAHTKYLGWFGVIGGIIGLVLIPIIFMGTAALGLQLNSFLTVLLGLNIVGCILAIYTGRVLLKSAGSSESNRTGLGFVAIVYGLGMFLLYSVLRFV